MRCLLFALLILTGGGTVWGDPVDSNFTVDDLQFGAGKTKVEFDSAGRMYVTEKQGRVLLFTPDGSGGVNSPDVLLNLTAVVDPSLESGLLGFEIDPDHANNRFIYLFYTTATDQRLVRYTMNSSFNGLEANSELVLLSGLPRLVTFHKAGDIGIRPGDPYAIYVSLGDDDLVNRAQNLDYYEGKILRVDTSTGLGLPDNPFFDGDPDSIESRIWARGFRNPFRFTFHPTRSDVLLVSENGDATDRIAWVRRGSNGEWGPGGDNGGFLNPSDTDFRVMETGGPSYIGITVITEGPFAYNGLPTLYLGNWFPNTTGVRRFTMSGADLDTLTPISDGNGGDFWEAGAIAVDLELGADGHLYYTETGGNSSAGVGQNFYGVRRYRFDSGSPPAAAFTSSSSAGEAPALVSFTDATVEGTYSIASWSWDFGDGTTSSLQSPSHTFDEPGVYSVELVVTDSVGLTSVASEQVIITDTTTVTLDLELFDGRTLPETPLATPTGIAFFQRDGITPLAFVGGSGAEGNQWLVPAGGGLNQVFDLPLTGNGFVVVVGDSDMHGFHARTMALDVEPGEPITVPRAICLSDTAIAGRITSVSGEPAQVDLGVWHAGSAFEVACGRDYLPDAIYPSTGVNHRVETDGEGYYYIALPNSADGMSFELDVVGDVQRDRFVAAEVNATASAGSSVVIDIEVAEWRRGGGDDLSGIPMTPAVDFADVQAIFSANCTGCHRANTSNNGGLDLTEGNSLGELLGQPSLFVDGLLLVDPGSPERSYLFEKINSANPQQGARMRPSDAMPLADQALIRDWIAQLTPSYESFLISNYGVGAGDEGAGLFEDFDEDGVINGQAYSELRVAQSAVAGGEWQVEFELLPTLSGLTVLVEVSDDLADQSWRTVAVRPRGSSSWTTGAGISVLESPPGRVVLSDEAISSRDRRFYRMTLREF